MGCSTPRKPVTIPQWLKSPHCQQSVHTETLRAEFSLESSHYAGKKPKSPPLLSSSQQHCQANVSSCAWHSNHAAMLSRKLHFQGLQEELDAVKSIQNYIYALHTFIHLKTNQSIPAEYLDNNKEKHLLGFRHF